MNKSKRGANWSVDEEKSSCMAWCKVSYDGDVGNGQDYLTFYDRIKVVYKTMIQGTERSQTSMSADSVILGRLIACGNGF